MHFKSNSLFYVISLYEVSSPFAMEEPLNDSREMPINSIERVDLLVGFKGVCFLCLQEIPDSLSNSSTNAQEVCLRNICRYLEIDTYSILQKSLSTNLKKLPENLDKWDVNVTLCVQCAGVTEKLSDLVWGLELTKMLLHDKVRQFHRILNGSWIIPKIDEEAGDRWEEVKKTMVASSGENMIEVQLMEKLRQETATKCSRKLKHIITHSYPKVRLENIISENFNNDSDLPNESDLEDSLSTTSSSSENSKIFHLNLLPKPEMGFINPLQLIRDTRSENFIYYDQALSKCLFCKKILANKNPTVHLVYAHLEKLFENCKLPAVSNKHFSTCCQHALNTRLYHRGPGKMRSYHCNICDKNLCNNNHLYQHIVTKHYQNIQRNILKFQRKRRKRDLIKIKKMVKMAKIANIQVRGNYLIRAAKVVKKQIHTQKLTSKAMAKYFEEVQSGTQMKCLLCKSFLLNQASQRDHLLLEHLDKWFPGKRLETVTDEQFQYCCRYMITTETAKVQSKQKQKYKRKKIKCRFCKFTCITTNYIYHLVVSHYQNLVANLKRFQQHEVWKKRKFNPKRKPKLSVQQKIAKISRNYFTKTQSENELHCKNCKCKVLKANVNVHLGTRHPDKVFSVEKLESLSNEQFLQCCEHALFLTTDKAKRIKLDKATHACLKCPFCPIVSAQSQHLRYHLVIEHYQNIQEEIRRIQVDGIPDGEQVVLRKRGRPKTRNTESDANDEFKSEFWENQQFEIGTNTDTKPIVLESYEISDLNEQSVNNSGIKNDGCDMFEETSTDDLYDDPLTLDGLAKEMLNEDVKPNISVQE